jgi:hypothetical protein
MSQKRLAENDVKWVVNSLGELGVCIEGQYFFCYKGESIQYTSGDIGRDDEVPLLVRGVGKREFGEVVNPAAWYRPGFRCPDFYDEPVVWNSIGIIPDEVQKFYEWQPLPPPPGGVGG